MDKMSKTMNENEFLGKIVEDILFDINSKTYVINDFREKYLNQTLYDNNKSYSKERKDRITIKISAINKILNLFKKTISISIKAIIILLIKNKINNKLEYNFNLNRFINIQEFNKNLNLHSYNDKKIKNKDDRNSKYHSDNKINLTKNNSNINKSYCNQIKNQEKNKKSKSYNRLLSSSKGKNMNNINKRILVDDTNSKEKLMNKTDLIIKNFQNKTHSNFNSYIKNIQESIPKNNNYVKKDLNSEMDSKKKKYYSIGNNKNNKKCNYIKLKNLKLKIQNPLKQTFRDMVKKQKLKAKNSSQKIIPTYKNKEENKNNTISSPIYDKKKLNNFKLFLAEKYGNGNYNNFLNKYKDNKVNKLIIENEFQILSKMNNDKYSSNSNKYMTERNSNKFLKNNASPNSHFKTSERISLNYYSKKKNLPKDYKYRTPKTQECYKKKTLQNIKKKTNSLKNINSKIFSSIRYTGGSSNKRNKNTIDKSDKINTVY